MEGGGVILVLCFINFLAISAGVVESKDKETCSLAIPLGWERVVQQAERNNQVKMKGSENTVMEDKTEQEGGKRAWKCGNVGEDAGGKQIWKRLWCVRAIKQTSYLENLGNPITARQAGTLIARQVWLEKWAVKQFRPNYTSK